MTSLKIRIKLGLMKKLLGIVVLGLGFMIIVNAPKQALAKDADGLIKELVNLAERGHEINFDAREMLGG